MQLLLILAKNPNFLILDEPTNDLDITTLNVLEDFLVGFPGCLMVVSHDRWFLDRIATHILAFEGDSVEWYDGNYTEYEEYRRKKLGSNAGPKRVKYKKMA